MSEPAAQLAPDQIPDTEVARAAIDTAFAEARDVMTRHGVPPHGQVHEFMVHAIDRFAGAEDTRARARVKIGEMVEDVLDFLFEGEEVEAAPAVVQAGTEPALDPEVALVTRLTLDMSLADFKLNNGFARMKGDYVVTQAIGLLEQAKRQISDLRAGRTVIKDSAAPAEAAPAAA